MEKQLTFWFREQSNPVHTDDSIGVAPAAQLSADWRCCAEVACIAGG